LFVAGSSIESDEIVFGVKVVSETITDSPYYTDVDPTHATITLCFRVDYNYKDDKGGAVSVNFHETKLAINVDLTAGFSLSTIDMGRYAMADIDASTTLAYPVIAYFCSDDNAVDEPFAFSQGTTLQVCVAMEDSVTEKVYVSDILTFIISQPDGVSSSSKASDQAIPDPLTTKLCGIDGICNVKSQLSSKFFGEETIPQDLLVEGVALLALGSERRLGQAPVRSRLRHDPETSSARYLQSEPPTAPFGLTVKLADNADTENSTSTIIYACAIASVTCVVALFMFCVYRMKCTAKEDSEEKKNVVETKKTSIVDSEKCDEGGGSASTLQFTGEQDKQPSGETVPVDDNSRSESPVPVLDNDQKCNVRKKTSTGEAIPLPPKKTESCLSMPAPSGLSRILPSSEDQDLGPEARPSTNKEGEKCLASGTASNAFAPMTGLGFAKRSILFGEPQSKISEGQGSQCLSSEDLSEAFKDIESAEYLGFWKAKR